MLFDFVQNNNNQWFFISLIFLQWQEKRKKMGPAVITGLLSLPAPKKAIPGKQESIQSISLMKSWKTLSK